MLSSLFESSKAKFAPYFNTSATGGTMQPKENKENNSREQ